VKNRVYALLKFAIGWPLSLLAFIFIVKLIAPQTGYLLSHLGQLNWPLFVYGTISFLAFYYLRGYIWHLMLRNLGYTIPFHTSCFLWSFSELKRYIPGNIWSFLGRAVLFSEAGVKKKDIATSLVIEAEIFVIGTAIVSLLSLPFFAHYFFHWLTIAQSNLIVLLVGVLTLIYLYNHKVVNLFSGKMGQWFRLLLPPYRPRETFTLVSLSVVAVFLFGLGYFFIISALSPLQPQLVLQFIGLFVFSFLAGYVSFLTPAGFGVREGILIIALSKFFSASLAGLLALFVRIILIIIELVFVGLTFFLYRNKNKKLLAVQDWLDKHKQESLLVCLLVMYLVYFTTVSFLRYDNFYTGRFDLGNMAQTVWNTMHGRIFEFTNPNGTAPISRLAFHADFLLILLAPFYALWPDPRNLLLIQTIVLAAGAWFVYLLAKDVLRSKNFAVLFAFVYLINPSIERTNLYDFHAITLSTTFLLAAFYFIRKNKFLWFAVFAILAALGKEEIWVITAMYGVYILLWQKRRFLGSMTFLFSMAAFYYLIWHAIPQNLGSQHFALSYYSDFGSKPSTVIKSVLLSPGKVFGIIFERSRLLYLNALFTPLGYLSLLAPWFIIFAVPDLLLNMLSNNPQTYQIYYQYTAAISPFLLIAAIFGVANFKKLFPKLPALLIGLFLFTCTMYEAFLYGPLPGAREQNIAMITQPVANRAFITSYLLHIPKRFSVAASNNVGSHLSQRQAIYTLPLGYDKADVIVFLLNPHSEPGSSLTAEEQLVMKMKHDPAYYQLLIEKDQFLVFRRI